MANLFFPQLSTGAIAQYPIKKTLVSRSITNLLPDGSMILQADPGASKLIWEMSFSELATADSQALQAHFEACYGPYYAFTFIDPTDNMLASSADLTNTAWTKDPQIQIVAGTADPSGGSSAFMVTNAGSAPQNISQRVAVPAGYQYCFSLFALSAVPAALTVLRQGTSATATDILQVRTAWTRFVSSGQLNDSGTQFSIVITLNPGQQIKLFGLQLEAQIQPSRYRPTVANGGVYPLCHWTSDTFPLVAEAPNLFSTGFAIETNL